MVKEWIPLNFWLRELESTLFDSLVNQFAKRQAFCGRMLYIAMQTTEMRVPPLFFHGFLDTWLGLKTPSAIHLSKSTSSSFGVQGIGGGLSYFFPSGLFLFLLVDTTMACGNDFYSFGFSKLGLTKLSFLAFCSSWANYAISKFSRIALYSIIVLPIHIFDKEANSKKAQ